MFSRWKLALETSANFVATRAGIQRRFPALDSSASFRQVCHGHKCTQLRLLEVSSAVEI